MARLMANELSYWSDLDENVIGTVFEDVCDKDFGWILLVRDRLGRFRSVDVDASIESERRAEVSLRLKIAEVSRMPISRSSASKATRQMPPWTC